MKDFMVTFNYIKTSKYMILRLILYTLDYLYRPFLLKEFRQVMIRSSVKNNKLSNKELIHTEP